MLGGGERIDISEGGDRFHWGSGHVNGIKRHIGGSRRQISVGGGDINLWGSNNI